MIALLLAVLGLYLCVGTVRTYGERLRVGTLYVTAGEVVVVVIYSIVVWTTILL